MNPIKKTILTRLRQLYAPFDRNHEKLVVLQSTAIAKAQRGQQRVASLREVEFSGFSQWGEDGIIDWLIERLPGIPPTFVEFGVGDYRESNTRLLLHTRNWRGLVIDGSPEHIASIQSQDVSWRFDLTAKCAFIDRDSINHLIAESGLSGDIGLLSVDIDGNDYWVWEAINSVNPAIVICEYNGIFGDRHKISTPYQPDFQRTNAHHSNIYFGASLPALIELGMKKGYTFVGTNANGCNAFFVRGDLAPNIVSAIGEIKAYPSLVREARDAAGQLTFTGGDRRVDVIRHLPVHDFDSASVRTIAELGELYSAGWSRN